MVYPTQPKKRVKRIEMRVQFVGKTVSDTSTHYASMIKIRQRTHQTAISGILSGNQLLLNDWSLQKTGCSHVKMTMRFASNGR